MATVMITSRGAKKDKLVESLGMSLTTIDASFLANAFLSALRAYSKPKYLAAVKEGVQTEMIALHNDEALNNFIYYAKECYDDEPMELTLIDLSDEKHAMISAYLGELKLH